MTKLVGLFLLVTGLSFAEVHSMTLRQAVDLALKQSPDVMMARLDEQKARAGIQLAKDPFTPKIYGGSGLAWTEGFPTSIGGSAPSVFEVRTDMSLYDRSQHYALARAREDEHGSEIQTASSEDDVVYRTASLYLDAGQAARSVEAAQRQLESLQKVESVIKLLVQEGRELPVEEKVAELNVAKAQQRIEDLKMQQEDAETSLALVLGYGPNDRVQAVETEPVALALPANENATVETALMNNKQIRLLESQMQAREMDILGAKAQRLPKIGVVAQYSLLAKFNNFQQYFAAFQRNNAELGVSIQIPFLVGSGHGAEIAQAQADVTKLQKQVSQARNQVTMEIRRAFQDVTRAQTALDVARLDLEVARDQLSTLLAQTDEGRASMTQVEDARVQENAKWIAFYDANDAVARARLNVLKDTGGLVAALQ